MNAETLRKIGELLAAGGTLGILALAFTKNSGAAVACLGAIAVGYGLYKLAGKIESWTQPPV